MKLRTTQKQKNKAFLTTQYLNEGDLRAIDPQDRKFSYQQIDLNNDGKKETFVDFFYALFLWNRWMYYCSSR